MNRIKCLIYSMLYNVLSSSEKYIIDLFAHIYIGLKRIKNKRGENKCKIIY